MSENKYVIISLKHTHKKDMFFTFWGPNHSGYCWHKNMIGTYLMGFTDDIKREKDMVYIRLDIIEPLFTPVIDGSGKPRLIVFNNGSNRRALNILSSMLIEYNQTTVGHIQIITPSVIKEYKEMVALMTTMHKEYISLKKSSHDHREQTS